MVVDLKNVNTAKIYTNFWLNDEYYYTISYSQLVAVRVKQGDDTFVEDHLVNGRLCEFRVLQTFLDRVDCFILMSI